jgi:hypothetical protein
MHPRPPKLSAHEALDLWYVNGVTGRQEAYCMSLFCSWTGSIDFSDFIYKAQLKNKMIAK